MVTLRTIVLSIKDNDAANEFAKAMLEAERNGMPFVPQGTTINAIIARPTLACKCNSRKKLTGWTRTPRFGWFVCPVCKRPSYYVVRDFIKNMLHGQNNLLQEFINGQTTKPPTVNEMAAIQVLPPADMVTTYPSASQPGVTYRQELRGDKWTCDCKGYQYQNKCKHVTYNETKFGNADNKFMHDRSDDPDYSERELGS